MHEPDVRWEMPQTIDTIDPALVALQREVGLRENAAARRDDLGRCPEHAKERCQRDLAHDNSHDRLPDLPHLVGDELLRLPPADAANQRVPLNKFEGITDRNYTTYNPQVVRDDVFMLGAGRHGERATAWP